MPSIKQLEREKARLLKIRDRELKKSAAIQKRKDLQREIFLLRHGRTVDTLKKGYKGTQKFLTKAQKWAEKRQGGQKRRRKNNYDYEGGSIW